MDAGGDSTVPELCCSPFHYVNQSGTFINNKSDADKYNGLTHSLTTLGFQPEVVQSMHRIVAGILHLGNVSFATLDDATRDGSVVRRRRQRCDYW